MLSWFYTNIGTIIVCSVLTAVVAFIIIKMRKNKKNGSSCCGGCTGCPMAGKCHSDNQSQ